LRDEAKAAAAANNMNAMRMKRIRLVFAGLSISLFAACTTTQHSAPVVDRSPTGRATETAKPRADARGYYTVKRGDTLYRIALEFNQNVRDLVAWNNLDSPNDIKVDQQLRVLPPEGGSASGAQTGSVASTSGVEVRPLSSAPTSPAMAGTNKTGPRGEKRPFSESNLAELQKPDADGAALKPDTPKAAEAKSDTAPTPDVGIDWMWPAEGKIIGTFDKGKKGIDIAGKSGQPVVAAGPGTVLYASSVRGYGNLVIVKHNNNLLSAYAHNKTILVKEGQTVNRGQKIAEMGNSDTDSVKLHFEIRQQGKPVDPAKFLPNR
jgi:lipoprotein NlpD